MAEKTRVKLTKNAGYLDVYLFPDHPGAAWHDLTEMTYFSKLAGGKRSAWRRGRGGPPRSRGGEDTYTLGRPEGGQDRFTAAEIRALLGIVRAPRTPPEPTPTVLLPPTPAFAAAAQPAASPAPAAAYYIVARDGLKRFPTEAEAKAAASAHGPMANGKLLIARVVGEYDGTREPYARLA